MNRFVFSLALLIASTQLAGGIFGLWYGIYRGQQSGLIRVDDTGRIVESSTTYEPAPIIIVMAALIAAGAFLALAGLLLVRHQPKVRGVSVVSGAVLGLPLAVTIILSPLPLVLAVLGVLLGKEQARAREA